MIRTAYLRVYEPVDRVAAYREHRWAPRSVVRADEEFVWAEPTHEDALEAHWSDTTWVCPRHPRLRMLEGLLAFSNAHPGSGLMSELAVRKAVKELKAIKDANPDARSHILSTPWHVPLRWFAAFTAEERDVYNTSNGVSIRYRTTVALALDRVTEAIDTLENAGFDTNIIEDVSDLEHWLDQFDGDAMLELDYHSVAQHFEPTDLIFDESASDVNRSLELLRAGEWEEAGLAYAAVASRWMSAQALTYVN